MNTLIEPAYKPNHEASEIELYAGPVQVTDGAKTIRGNGRAVLKFRPKMNLKFEADFSSSDVGHSLSLLSAAKTARVEIDRGFADTIVTQLNSGFSEQGVTIKASLTPNPQRISFNQNQLAKLKRLIVHVVNFPRFNGPTDLSYEYKPGAFKTLGRAILENGEWRAELQELPQTRDLVEAMKDSASFGITHAIEAKRCDGSEFTAIDAEKITQKLYLFLSFAKGAWTAPILSVGYDRDNKVAYEEWGLRLVTPWETRTGWFDTNHSASLSELFSNFCKLLDKETIGKAVSNSLYWYLRSNRGGDGAGIDSGVILSQAALERLSSAVTQSAGLKSRQKLTAASKLRAALIHLGISTAIPVELQKLCSISNRENWIDAPDAITKIRNELVHPESFHSIGPAIGDAWNLAQRYIELIVLRLSDYEGLYSNRLKARWVGQVETVPWSKDKTWK